MQLDFWIDPACPWCWLTSRWVEDIAEDRDLDVRWRSISLLFLNDPPVGSSYHAGVVRTHDAQVRAWGVRMAPTVLFFGRGGIEVAERLVGAGMPDFYGAYLEERLTTARNALG